jgi:hypothetical protein
MCDLKKACGDVLRCRRSGGVPRRPRPAPRSALCGSLALSARDDAPCHEAAERSDEERKNRQCRADHANRRQYEPDDSNHPGDEATDGVPVEPSFPNPSRRVTPAPLNVTHSSRVARALNAARRLSLSGCRTRVRGAASNATGVRGVIERPRRRRGPVRPGERPAPVAASAARAPGPARRRTRASAAARAGRVPPGLRRGPV